MRVKGKLRNWRKVEMRGDTEGYVDKCLWQPSANHPFSYLGWLLMPMAAWG